MFAFHWRYGRFVRPIQFFLAKLRSLRLMTYRNINDETLSFFYFWKSSFCGEKCAKASGSFALAKREHFLVFRFVFLTKRCLLLSR